MMREVMELETDEICKELTITANNLWVILYRARVALRLCLEQNWFARERPRADATRMIDEAAALDRPYAVLQGREPLASRRCRTPTSRRSQRWLLKLHLRVLRRLHALQGAAHVPARGHAALPLVTAAWPARCRVQRATACSARLRAGRDAIADVVERAGPRGQAHRRRAQRRDRAEEPARRHADCRRRPNRDRRRGRRRLTRQRSKIPP